MHMSVPSGLRMLSGWMQHEGRNIHLNVWNPWGEKAASSQDNKVIYFLSELEVLLNTVH